MLQWRGERDVFSVNVQKEQRFKFSLLVQQEFPISTGSCVEKAMSQPCPHLEYLQLSGHDMCEGACPPPSPPVMTCSTEKWEFASLLLCKAARWGSCLFITLSSLSPVLSALLPRPLLAYCNKSLFWIPHVMESKQELLKSLSERHCCYCGHIRWVQGMTRPDLLLNSKHRYVIKKKKRR